MKLQQILQDRWCLWLLLAGLLVRCAAVPLLHQLGYTSDEREFLLLAERLVAGDGFVDSNGTLSVRAPLYPVVLAGLLTLDGGRLALPHLFGVLLGTLLILQVYLLALEWTGRREIARWSAGFTALTPGLITYSALLQSEALAIPLFCGWLLAGARLMKEGGWGRAARLGALAGFAALTRAVFLPVAVWYGLLFIWRGGTAKWRTWGMLGLAAVVAAAVLLPWGVRNYRLHHAIVPVSTFGGMSFLLGNNPYTEGTTQLADGFDGWFAEQVERRTGSPPEELTEAGRSGISADIAWSYISAHPGRVAYLLVRKCQVMLAYPVSSTSSHLPLQLSVVALEFLVAVLAAFGIASAPGPRAWLWTACGVILFIVIMHTLLHAEARYRLPVLPILAVSAGAGVVSLLGVLRRERRIARTDLRRSVLLVGGVLLLYGVTAWMFVTGSIS